MPLAPFGPYGFNVAVLLISIMISVSGILLALGYAIDDKKLKEIGRRELYQSIVNGILVGSLLFLFINNGPISVLVNSLMPKNSSFSSAWCDIFYRNKSLDCNFQFFISA